MPLKETVSVPGDTVTFWLAIGLMVGGSLTAFTVRLKKVLALVTPSLTVSLMAAVPLWSGAGVMVTVRFVPKPLTTMLVVGPMVGLEETAVTFSSNAVV